VASKQVFGLIQAEAENLSVEIIVLVSEFMVLLLEVEIHQCVIHTKFQEVRLL